MKIKQVITLLIIVTISSTLKSQNAAGDYMDKIGQQFDQISSNTWDYVSAASHGKSARKIENRRHELIKTTAEAQQTINKMEPFQGDASLKDTVLSYLQLSYDVLNKDFAKIVDMEDIAEQSYDNMEAYLLAQQMADDKLDKANDNMIQEQKKFAASHGITLTDNKTTITKKLETSSAVIKYYNEVYLIFFKSYKQEAYLLNAMNTNDVNGMEQNKNALIKCSTAGLKSLDTIKSFKGDISLVTSAKELLNFYKTESSTKMKDVIDYFLAKEKYDKIKAAYDAKDKSSLTQADADQYNKAVNELNTSAKKYSATNDDLNKKRAVAVDNWNKTAAKFMDTHVPKYKQ